MKTLLGALMLSLSCLSADDGPVSVPSVYLDQIWRSYTGQDIRYERFYRITIYQINSPRVCVGIFVGGDKSHVAWAYTEFENNTYRHIVARKEAEADVDALAKGLEEIFEIGGDGFGDGFSEGLDGTTIRIEFLRPEVEDPVKTTNWKMSQVKNSELLNEFQTKLVSLWNDLPNTIDLKNYE